jgi:hypothetical protein
MEEVKCPNCGGGLTSVDTGWGFAVMVGIAAMTVAGPLGLLAAPIFKSCMDGAVCISCAQMAD